ncbi:50S ribosomal protein L6 [Oleiphilus sp. HI0071]|jgi:large subunit ribosomal protein L6|uniref:50S ribosomal protein L6 n=2 Tax=Oleiphilus TaxID=141450 RepID=UPI0007C3D860|nr:MULTISPECIES: 50S ribosomal protein L6 [unclassified Oleiphilus]KZY61883.1 50S ribosomal protein L6 [Oleiphilus sp. HI0065]KZY79428.1 50S ribosomal protein L6 [Oleiphilus sp. HI0071]KZZ05564.1 50S ribosomal protein L6 [Oleiphilus sp. HI0073]KZZ52625.1 50S ribosomal protein L6 [Oleiphilus sp. HI0118]KZZ61497.1 50S ribosomal protein L6 [Oleiphilus sp. HI0122]KZZ74888.1 50S ribosomal protein L6 [Oleiphilus sp. HI0133]KZZ76038.1 50S ribosomal protein L6 [Oleiphilus sp. HI0130]
MSRVASNPVALPSGVEVKLGEGQLEVKGSKGSLSMEVNPVVEINQDGSTLTFAAKNGSKFSKAMSGTTRALVNNMVTGVTSGFQKKLQLIGVGYRVQVQGQKLNLNLGFSHPVEYELPKDVKAESPSQTEIVLTSIDKQLLGQVAADIRAFRPPEPYKGKGVRYADEHVRRKEAKKK